MFWKVILPSIPNGKNSNIAFLGELEVRDTGKTYQQREDSGEMLIQGENKGWNKVRPFICKHTIQSCVFYIFVNKHTIRNFPVKGVEYILKGKMGLK